MSNTPSRSAARLAAVQALFQMEFSGQDNKTVEAEFVTHRLGATIEGHQYKPADEALFCTLLTGVVERQRDIDPLTDKAMKESWPLDRIDSTLRAIFRAATYELLALHDIPVKVVLNEYVDVAKAFFGDGAEAKFANAVLDNIAHKVRAKEFEHPSF